MQRMTNVSHIPLKQSEIEYSLSLQLEPSYQVYFHAVHAVELVSLAMSELSE